MSEKRFKFVFEYLIVSVFIIVCGFAVLCMTLTIIRGIDEGSIRMQIPLFVLSGMLFIGAGLVGVLFVGVRRRVRERPREVVPYKFGTSRGVPPHERFDALEEQLNNAVTEMRNYEERITQERYIMDKKRKRVNLKPFVINERITMKFEKGKTKIYIDGKYFIQCAYLLLKLKPDGEYEDIRSIDDIAEGLDNRLERVPGELVGLTPEQEFIGHCSNIQAWVENDYNTKILHSSIAFPLLRKLTELGDLKAKQAFAEEIVIRFLEGNSTVREYLNIGGYLNHLNKTQLLYLATELIEREGKIDIIGDTNKKIYFPDF